MFYQIKKKYLKATKSIRLVYYLNNKDLQSMDINILTSSKPGDISYERASWKEEQA
jgi:hypothetical protein